MSTHITSTRKAVISCTRDAHDEVRELVRGGLVAGWYRAHKHEPYPDVERIVEHQTQAVMDNFHEWAVIRWARRSSTD